MPVNPKELSPLEMIQMAQKKLSEAESEILVDYFYKNFLKMNFNRIDLYSAQKVSLPKGFFEIFEDAIQRRIRGVPLQHITGEQVFLKHTYKVSPEVLIPRPETESLVHFAIQYFKENNRSPLKGIEIGLGSGVISLELLSEFPELQMHASEQSSPAIALAQENVRYVNSQDSQSTVISRLTISQPYSSTDVWSCFSQNEKVDFIISNPPYLDRLDPIEKQVLDYEPSEALFPSSTDSLYFYRKIAEQARFYFQDKGLIFLEISEFRSREIAELFTQESFDVEVFQDFNDRDRILLAKWTK